MKKAAWPGPHHPANSRPDARFPRAPVTRQHLGVLTKIAPADGVPVELPAPRAVSASSYEGRCHDGLWTSEGGGGRSRLPAELIANLTSFNTAGADGGWVKDADGRRLHYPIDNYLQERAMWIEYRGIRVVYHHRPMSAYLRALLGAGLVLTHFDEPAPSTDAPASRAARYARAPWFLVMEWLKPSAA